MATKINSQIKTPFFLSLSCKNLLPLSLSLSLSHSLFLSLSCARICFLSLSLALSCKRVCDAEREKNASLYLCFVYHPFCVSGWVCLNEFSLSPSLSLSVSCVYDRERVPMSEAEANRRKKDK